MRKYIDDDVATWHYDGTITPVDQYGHTKVRVHDWNGVGDDENAEIFSHDTSTLTTRAERNAISKRKKDAKIERF